VSLESAGVYEAIQLACLRCGGRGELPRDYIGTRPSRYIDCPDCQTPNRPDETDREVTL
jgi:hypothetical protein